MVIAALVGHLVREVNAELLYGWRCYGEYRGQGDVIVKIGGGGCQVMLW